jgi:two-component system copper resistance phosphate regulon response regulator CusR
MRILLVEDEGKTAAYLSKGLSENGFTVDVARPKAEGDRKSVGRERVFDKV